MKLWLCAWICWAVLSCGGAPAAEPAAPPTSTPPAAAPPAPSAEPAAHHPSAAHAHEPTHAGASHRFTDAERWSRVFDDPKREAWQKPAEVVKQLALKPDAVVADLGAGTGYFTVRLARAVPKGRVLAVDNEPNMVDFTLKRAEREGLSNIEGIVAKDSDPKLPEGVDVVLIVDTYHHLSDRVAYMKRVRERLAPGGRVVIVDFKMGKLPIGPPDDHKIARETIESELGAAGFSLCRSWDGLPYQHTLFFSERC